ncbi:unnamed protein product [Lathyrus sativus]|nr:unnamed protein product [Lathyrus sativus]
MRKWKSIALTKEEEEEEVVTVAIKEVSGEEIFQRTLAGKLWTDNKFNARVCMSTMVGVWKLKNLVETHELRTNIFLYCFATKRDLENVLRNV